MQSRGSSQPSCPLCKRRITHFLYDISSPFEFKRVELRDGMKLPAPTGWVPGCDSHAHRFRRRVYLHDLRFTGKRLTIPPGAFPVSHKTHESSVADSGGKASGPLVTTARLRRFLARELQALLQIEDVGMIQALIESELNLVGSCGVRLHGVEGSSRGKIREVGMYEFLKGDSGKFVRELEAFYAADMSVAAFDQWAQYYGPLPAAHDSAEVVRRDGVRSGDVRSDDVSRDAVVSSGLDDGDESGHSTRKRSEDQSTAGTSGGQAQGMKRKREDGRG
jgi:hypothetical protein